jgi:hypothetical protein
MAMDGAGMVVVRPRAGLAWAAFAVIVICLLAAAWTHSWTPLVFTWLPIALVLRGRDPIVVDGRFVRRGGIHPVEVDLATASVTREGGRWWVELFFLGRPFELRDADGQVLQVESWLWDASTRDLLLERIGDRAAS